MTQVSLATQASEAARVNFTLQPTDEFQEPRLNCAKFPYGQFLPPPLLATYVQSFGRKVIQNRTIFSKDLKIPDINHGRLQGKLHQDVCGQVRGYVEGSLENKEICSLSL